MKKGGFHLLALTVTEDENGAGIQLLEIDNILFMQADLRTSLIVHTKDKRFYTVGSLRYWENAFSHQSDLNFLRLDRGILANLDRIEAVDPALKLAYFGYPVTETTKSCTISDGRFKQFLERIDRELPKLS